MLDPAPICAGRGRYAPPESTISVVGVLAGIELLFHIGLAVTMSNWRRVPSPDVNAGWCIVSPRAMCHSRDGQRGSVDFLAVDAERRGTRWKFHAAVLLFAVRFEQTQVALDEQTTGTTAGVVYGFARLRVQDVGHQDCHFAWGVELACALALTFGKFAEQIFISPSLSVTGTATRHLLAYWKRIRGRVASRALFVVRVMS